MNLQEKAIVRQQIEDLTRMQKELQKDRDAVNQELKKIAQLLNKRISEKDKQILKQHEETYKKNIEEIHYSINETNKIIHQLRLEVKPRAHIQITKKLF